MHPAYSFLHLQTRQPADLVIPLALKKKGRRSSYMPPTPCLSVVPSPCRTVPNNFCVVPGSWQPPRSACVAYRCGDAALPCRCEGSCLARPKPEPRHDLGSCCSARYLVKCSWKKERLFLWTTWSALFERREKTPTKFNGRDGRVLRREGWLQTCAVGSSKRGCLRVTLACYLA